MWWYRRFHFCLNFFKCAGNTGSGWQERYILKTDEEFPYSGFLVLVICLMMSALICLIMRFLVVCLLMRALICLIMRVLIICLVMRVLICLLIRVLIICLVMRVLVICLIINDGSSDNMFSNESSGHFFQI